MEDVKRILAISRMTKCCRKAISYGVSLSQKYGAELFVMHVIHNLFGMEGLNVPIVSIEAEYRKEREKTRKELDELIQKENRAGMAIVELIQEGEPTAEIFRAIKEKNIDLLIMTAHEEGRLEHFLFGRSNDEIIRKMPCSVFLVKQPLKPARYQGSD